MTDNICIQIAAELEVQELAKVIAAQRELSVDVVKAIDKVMADWGFTKELFDYFTSEMLKYN